MGCEHWNDYMRAMAGVLVGYGKVSEVIGTSCPYCILESFAAKAKTLEEGLRSIAKNSCCAPCREAGQIAQTTLREAGVQA